LDRKCLIREPLVAQRNERMQQKTTQ